MFARFNMLGTPIIKSANIRLGYGISKAMTHTREAHYKSDILFHKRLKVLENTITLLAKAILNDLKALKTQNKWT